MKKVLSLFIGLFAASFLKADPRFYALLNNIIPVADRGTQIKICNFLENHNQLLLENKDACHPTRSLTNEELAEMAKSYRNQPSEEVVIEVDPAQEQEQKAKEGWGAWFKRKTKEWDPISGWYYSE